MQEFGHTVEDYLFSSKRSIKRSKLRSIRGVSRSRVCFPHPVIGFAEGPLLGPHLLPSLGLRRRGSTGAPRATSRLLIPRIIIVVTVGIFFFFIFIINVVVVQVVIKQI